MTQAEDKDLLPAATFVAFSNPGTSPQLRGRSQTSQERLLKRADSP